MSKTALRAWWGFGIGLTLTVVLTAIYFSEHGQKPAEDPSIAQKTAAAAKPAPRFKLKDAVGKEHTLEELQGNAVLLHFWASWCPPCIDEIPVFLELGKKLSGRPVKILFVNLDTRWEDAHKVLPQKSLAENMLSVMDEGGKLPEEYGTYQFPETYLINPKLEIVTKWVGPQDWKSSKIMDPIEKVIADKK